MFFRISILVVLAALLSACSGGGGGGDGGSPRSQAICQAIGDGSYVSAAGIDDPVLGFDGHLDSWATLAPAASASGTLLGGNAPRPAGDVAGVAFTTPSDGSVHITINTYLGNVPRESWDVGTGVYGAGRSQVCNGGDCRDHESGLSFYGHPTLMDFDRIEAVISISGLNAPLQIRELCVS